MRNRDTNCLVPPQFCATTSTRPFGFTPLAEGTHIPPKSLVRMFSPAGNPRATNLFEIVSFLQHCEGVHFHVKASTT
jgi:DNA-binding phage protein